MDARLDEEQTQLRDAARDFLLRECDMTVVRQTMTDPHHFPEALWKQMGELGWLGLYSPAEYGGADLGLVTVSLLLEELGRALAPTSFLASAVLAVGCVQRFGSAEQRAHWLPALGSGRHRVALAHLETNTGWDARSITLEARRDGGGLRLRGRKLYVQDGLTSDLLLTTVRLGPEVDDIGLVLVDSGAKGLRLRAVDLYEKTRAWAEIEFDDVVIDAGALIVSGSRGKHAFDHLLDLSRVGLSAEMTGAARRVLEMSVDFAKQREQFGRPIGQFQAIAHKCADMLVAVESMTSAALYCAWAVEQGEPDASTSACLAKSFCSDSYTHVAGDGIQIHGGLGFTWEQDLHLYFKHAKAAEFLYGSSHALRETAAQSLIGSTAG